MIRVLKRLRGFRSMISREALLERGNAGSRAPLAPHEDAEPLSPHTTPGRPHVRMQKTPTSQKELSLPGRAQEIETQTQTLEIPN